MTKKLLALAFLATGCNAKIELEAGVYPLFSATLDGQDLETLPNVVLSVDPESGDAIFTEGPELLFTAVLAQLPDEASMSGCTDFLDSATMDTYSLSGADVIIGDLVFGDPLVYPDCADNGYVHIEETATAGDCSAGPCALFASPLDIYGETSD